MIYPELFWAFFQVGLFCIGGGYAALPLIQARIVDTHGWLTLTEFADVLAISQMTPGPIGINAATFVGTKIAGLPGAVISTLGCVTPSFGIVIGLAYIYTRYKNLKIIQGVLGGLRPAVVGLIAASGLSIAVFTFWPNASSLREIGGNIGDIDMFAVALYVISLCVLRKFKLSPIYVMLGSGALGVAAHLIQIV